jgi:hypothetical protein
MHHLGTAPGIRMLARSWDGTFGARQIGSIRIRGMRGSNGIQLYMPGLERIVGVGDGLATERQRRSLRVRIGRRAEKAAPLVWLEQCPTAV